MRERSALARSLRYHARMLKYRLIFGPIMIASLVGIFWLDNRLDQLSIKGTFWQSLFLGREYLPAGLLMFGLFLILIALASIELAAIFRAKGIMANTFLLAVSAIAGCTLLYIIPSTTTSQTTLAIEGTVIGTIFVVTMLQYSWAHRRTQGAAAVCGATLLALIYLGLLPGFYVAIRRWHSAWVVAAFLLVTKSSDIGAFFTGKAIGRHKLIPWLSPGKTWEGLIGGVVFSAIVAVGLAALMNANEVSGVYVKTDAGRVFRHFQFPLPAAAIAGAMIALIGQFGDLTASLFKRDAGIKDSGSSVPGFGGMLDILDSPIIVAPVAYWLLAWVASVG